MSRKALHFDLHTPCGECPFRIDIPCFLTEARVRHLLYEIIDCHRTFQCHKTRNACVEHHCAGALIMIEREMANGEHHMIRLARALTIYDPSQLYGHEIVYATRQQMIEASYGTLSKSE